MNTQSQCQAIRDHLESGNSITAIEALRRFKCFRLSARVLDLKERGLPITTEIVTEGGKRFARYSLEGKR